MKPALSAGACAAKVGLVGGLGAGGAEPVAWPAKVLPGLTELLWEQPQSCQGSPKLGLPVSQPQVGILPFSSLIWVYKLQHIFGL